MVRRIAVLAALSLPPLPAAAQTLEAQTLDIERFTWEADSAAAPLRIVAKGALGGTPFDLEGTAGPLADLTAGSGEPYPVAVSGTIAGEPAATRLTLRRPANGRPTLTGEVRLARLDVDSLTNGGAEATETIAGGASEDAGASSLPSGWETGVNTTIDVQVERLILGGVAFADARARLRLTEGVLAVQDFVLRGLGGRLAGDVRLEETATPAVAASLRLNADGIDFASLLSQAGIPETVTGEVNLDLELDGAGRTLDDLMGALEGEADVVSEDVEVLDPQLERLVADLDLFRVLPFWRRADTVRVNCLVGQFDIDGGVAETDALLDTRRMTVLGSGTVDLGAGRLDLSLLPRAKSAKLSATPIPVEIQGPIADPEISPAEETAGRLIGGVIGGLLFPLNQIAALAGRQTADACRDAIGKARAGGTWRDPPKAAPGTAEAR